MRRQSEETGRRERVRRQGEDAWGATYGDTLVWERRLVC